MRRDNDVKVYTNRPAIFARDATAATKRPARLVAKKTRAAIAVLTLLSSPAIAGPPYITDDPEPVDYQRWEFYAFSQGGRANGETSGVAPSCDCNYGILPDVQLHIQPGAAFRRASGASPAWGPGDTELGLKYRFVEQDKTNATPSIAFYPLLEAPTGDPTRGLGAGRTRALLPFWGQKDFGDWSTFGGGGYWINPGPGAKNNWFVGWVLQRKLTEQLAVGVELFHQTPTEISRLSVDRLQRRRDLRSQRTLSPARLGRQGPSARAGNRRLLMVYRPANHRRRVASISCSRRRCVAAPARPNHWRADRRRAL